METPPPTVWTPERIRDKRSALKMTQAEFAALLGYDRSRTVSDLERNQRPAPGPVCRVLDYVDRYGVLSPAE